MLNIERNSMDVNEITKYADKFKRLRINDSDDDDDHQRKKKCPEIFDIDDSIDFGKKFTLLSLKINS